MEIIISDNDNNVHGIIVSVNDNNVHGNNSSCKVYKRTWK